MKMGKTTESVEHKREFLYSFLTLIFIPFLYYFAVTSAFTLSPPSAVLPKVINNGAEEVRNSHSLSDVPGMNTDFEGNAANNYTISDEANVVEYILKKKVLPVETVLYVILFEVLKLLIIFSMYPAPHLFDQTSSIYSKLTWSNLRYAAGHIASSSSPSSGFQNHRGGGNSGSRTFPSRLPTFKRDQKDHLPMYTTHLGQKRLWQVWKGLYNYLFACGLCHVFVVMFGAPIINDLKLTFQFSVILTTWLFAPLCLAVHPGRLLEELIRIKSWSFETNELLWRAKWRFAITVFGAWTGAVVMPLDWDRPWQRWPIPCLASTTFTFFCFNLVLCLHLFCAIFEIYRFIPILARNKIKKI